MNRGGFSLNRLLGISRLKSQVSRATGIPWTRSGRQRKVGAMLGSAGLVLLGLSLLKRWRNR